MFGVLCLSNFTCNHLLSSFSVLFSLKKEVFSAISSLFTICLTNNCKYQANYITKTKLIIDVTVISV